VNDRLSTDLASLRIDRAAPVRRSPWVGRLALLIVLGAGGVGLWRWAPGFVEGQLFRPEVEVTEVAVLSPAQAAVELTAAGYVTAQVVAKVGSKVQGRLAEVRIKEGQAVKAGTILFVLDPADERSAVGAANARTEAARARTVAAEARVAEVKLQYDREKALVERGVRAPAGAEELGARLAALETEAKAAAAEVRVSQSEAGSVNLSLRNTTIVAPIDGTAITRPSQLGDVVGPQQTLVELADFSSLLVEVDVPEARLERVKIGGPVEIVLDSAPNQRLRGEVAELSPRLDRSKATALVRVRITDGFERVWPNMAARVSFLSKALDEAALKAVARRVLPKSALVERNGTNGVWVLDGDRLRWTPVSIAERLPSSIVLAEGPEVGTRLVDRPAPELSDGRSVKLKSP
jgi:RND family efflux transporter MFP subunit